MYTSKTNTLTGPRSFKATLHRAEKRVKYTNVVEVEAETFDFDASDAVSKPAQAALFKDYAATAKALKLDGATSRREANPRRIQYASGGPWCDAPKFTAAPIAANERKWLGREVGFRPSHTLTDMGGPVADHFVPVGDGVSVGGSDIIHGTVWSLAPYPKCFWVYVAGQGFYSVPEGGLLVGVNA